MSLTRRTALRKLGNLTCIPFVIPQVSFFYATFSGIVLAASMQLLLAQGSEKVGASTSSAVGAWLLFLSSLAWSVVAWGAQVFSLYLAGKREGSQELLETAKVFARWDRFARLRLAVVISLTLLAAGMALTFL